MGLDVDYDCWNGPYSAFRRFRNDLARAAGHEINADDKDYWKPEWDALPNVMDKIMGEWDEPPDDPLLVLLIHSDCDGVIKAEHVAPLRARLEELIPILEAGDDPDTVRGLGLVATTQRFIDGLKQAEEEGEDVEFG